MMPSFSVSRIFLIPFLFIWGVQGLDAQSPGGRSFQSLDLVGSARVAALGGHHNALHDDDLSLALQQPAILDSSLHKHLALNYVDHFAGINYGFASFAYDFGGNAGTWAANIQYVDYGEFDRRDLMGFKQGTFTANDQALNISHGRWLDSNFAVGGTFRVIYSVMEERWALGSGLDLSGIYCKRASNFTAGLVLRNMGATVKSYFPGNTAPLPFEIQAGMTKKLEHAPFRFGLVLRDLQQWDLTHPEEEEANDPLFQNEEEDSISTIERVSSFADKAMRHVVLNVEVLITENLHLRLGYDYRRRAEMRLEEKPGFVGFNWGFGFKIDRFNIAYARSSFHLTGGMNHFTVSTDLGAFRSKK